MPTSRRIAALLAATTLTAGLAVAPEVSASAAPYDCHVQAVLPGTVRISSTDVPLSLRAGDSEGCMEWGAWNILRFKDGPGHSYEADAKASYVYVDSSDNGQWDLYTNLYGSNGGPGTYAASYDDGYDLNSDPLDGYDSDFMTAKFASKIGGWSAHRHGSRVTLSAKVTRYTYTNGAYGTPGWGGWKAASVKFQYKSGGKWHTARTVHASKRGVATATTKRGRHVWRAVVAATGTTWGVATGNHTR
jgi:hypothetical protein